MLELNPQIRRRGFLAGLASLGLARAFGQNGPAAAADNPDTTTLDPDGTAHIARVVPIPETLSAAGQSYLATGKSWAPGPQSEQSKQLIELALRTYPVKVTEATLAGVPVKYFDPPSIPASRKDSILIDLHGGGFTVDSGSMLESIPIASLTRTRVIAVIYTLAPAAKFPVPVDQVVAVYRELLKTYKPQQIIVYGTSAGAILSAQVIMRFKAEKLPIPAGVGFFTGHADQKRHGDSTSFFAVPGLMGVRPPTKAPAPSANMGDHPLDDPLASPMFGDLSHFPPTLCMTGTRDLFLSGTSNFARALRKAGVASDLVVFDAMPHAHWYMIDIPEAKEALEIQSAFFNRILDGGRKA